MKKGVAIGDYANDHGQSGFLVASFLREIHSSASRLF